MPLFQFTLFHYDLEQFIFFLQKLSCLKVWLSSVFNFFFCKIKLQIFIFLFTNTHQIIPKELSVNLSLNVKSLHLTGRSHMKIQHIFFFWHLILSFQYHQQRKNHKKFSPTQDSCFDSLGNVKGMVCPFIIMCHLSRTCWIYLSQKKKKKKTMKKIQCQ